MKKILVLLILPLSSLGQQLLMIPDTLSGTFIPLEIKHDHMHFFSGDQTETMGINGPILAPTIILNKGQQVNFEVTNLLFDSTTIHWHGMHVSSENDGGPHTPIAPFTVWSPSFEVKDKASTLWYHPHLHHMTNMHVQMGIAGMIIVRDEEESALQLPRTYGIDDIPLVIQTKGFTNTNQIVVETAMDTTVMVNATIDPYVDLPGQVVRLRVLNGSSERVYNLGLSNGNSFFVIGTDGGLLAAPVSKNRLKLAPGERAEILLNLQGMEGQTIKLMSFSSELPNGTYGAAQPGMGPGQTIANYSLNPLNGSNFNLLTIQITSPTGNPIFTIPSTLVSPTPWIEGTQNATKTLTFSPQNMGPTAIAGPFFINSTLFNMDVINYQIPLNNIEIWTLQNNTPIAHPFHIHNVPFYILDINGVAPPPELAGRKDVVLVPGGQGTVRFITKFEDFANENVPYMYHCHMLTHEDGGMMGQYIVYDPQNNLLDPEQSALEMYPNPVLEELFIKTNTEFKQFNIVDPTGSIIQHASMPDNNKINLAQLKAGVYWIELIDINKRLTRNKISKL